MQTLKAGPSRRQAARLAHPPVLTGRQTHSSPEHRGASSHFSDWPRKESEPGDQVLPWSITPSAWSVCPGKRAVDAGAALAALVALTPFLLLIAALVWCSSPGPILFFQRRVGRHGKLFTILKFRTMTTRDSSDAPEITQQGDRRITQVGRFLRRCKLDELPQFFNVLTGDMSLVGPRPKLPHHEAMQLSFRPGLTGAATLAYRCEEEMLQRIPPNELESFYARTIKPHKASLDSEYMKRATLWSDLALICSTARACILRPRLAAEAANEDFNTAGLSVVTADESA